jgi:hypothetical protein
MISSIASRHKSSFITPPSNEKISTTNTSSPTDMSMHHSNIAEKAIILFSRKCDQKLRNKLYEVSESINQLMSWQYML